jgi:short-subunit dehydrogenase
MRDQGHGTIINVGSVSGFIGVPFHGVYAATRHALAGYTEAMRLEVEAFGVRVVLIEPSAHRTGIQMVRPGSLSPLYDEGRRRVESIIRTQIETGDAPERVAAAIHAAATCRHPPFRVRVGGKAAFGALARRLLPIRLFERLLRHELQ